jgi:hypothetical protein
MMGQNRGKTKNACIKMQCSVNCNQPADPPGESLFCLLPHPAPATCLQVHERHPGIFVLQNYCARTLDKRAASDRAFILPQNLNELQFLTDEHTIVKQGWADA